MLLEDIDAAFPSREESSIALEGAGGGRSDVTFSGLLNVLDGVSSRCNTNVFPSSLLLLLRYTMIHLHLIAIVNTVRRGWCL